MSAHYGVVLFPSVSHSLRAESLTRAAGLTVKLIPTPRQFSSECGTALRFDWVDRERVLEVLAEAGVENGEVREMGPAAGNTGA